jgi:hypothetical protein
MSANEPGSPSGHERRDADVISLAMIAGILLISGFIVILGCMALMHVFDLKDKSRQTRVQFAQPANAEFPEPRLQSLPARDLEKLRTAEEKELHSYGWIDRSAGIVRIPIERAMELIVQRGLPDVGANKTPLQLIQERPQQGETPAATPNTSR